MAAHGTFADGTAMQLASVTNSTGVLNVDEVSPQASLVALVDAKGALVAAHAVATRDVVARVVDDQAVAHGTAADGVFPLVSPLALQCTTSSRVVADEEAVDEAIVALVAAVVVELKRLVDSRSLCTVAL